MAFLRSIKAALLQARIGILIIATTNVVTISAGVLAVHTGNQFALSYRDSLVARAHRSDPAARANDAGAHGTAAVVDFSRNLGLAAVPETIGGLTLVLPVGTALREGRVVRVQGITGDVRIAVLD
jgi:hypothetical protein